MLVGFGGGACVGSVCNGAAVGRDGAAFTSPGDLDVVLERMTLADGECDEREACLASARAGCTGAARGAPDRYLFAIFPGAPRAPRDEHQERRAHERTVWLQRRAAQGA